MAESLQARNTVCNTGRMFQESIITGTDRKSLERHPSASRMQSEVDTKEKDELSLKGGSTSILEYEGTLVPETNVTTRSVS